MLKNDLLRFFWMMYGGVIKKSFKQWLIVIIPVLLAFVVGRFWFESSLYYFVFVGLALLLGLSVSYSLEKGWVFLKDKAFYLVFGKALGFIGLLFWSQVWFGGGWLFFWLSTLVLVVWVLWSRRVFLWDVVVSFEDLLFGDDEDENHVIDSEFLDGGDLDGKN